MRDSSYPGGSSPHLIPDEVHMKFISIRMSPEPELPLMPHRKEK
jgi:hypothetical protein